MNARCASLLFLALAAGCGKGVTPTQVVDVTLTTSAPAPVQTSAGAAAQPLRRSRLAGPAKEVFERRGWPSLSPDARTVVFLRRRDATQYSPKDIYLVRVDGGDAELLLREDPSVVVLYYELWGVNGADFSADGKRVFFAVMNGRDIAVLAIDLVTKKITAVASGWDYRVIRRGAHWGRLLMLKRRYPPTGGLEPACSIVSSVDGSLVQNIDCMATRALLGIEIL
jgi:hypothetical protein